jgi:hypothetical protein
MCCCFVDYDKTVNGRRSEFSTVRRVFSIRDCIIVTFDLLDEIDLDVRHFRFVRKNLHFILEMHIFATFVLACTVIATPQLADYATKITNALTNPAQNDCRKVMEHSQLVLDVDTPIVIKPRYYCGFPKNGTTDNCLRLPSSDLSTVVSLVRTKLGVGLLDRAGGALGLTPKKLVVESALQTNKMDVFVSELVPGAIRYHMAYGEGCDWRPKAPKDLRDRMTLQNFLSGKTTEWDLYKARDLVSTGGCTYFLVLGADVKRTDWGTADYPVTKFG